MIKDIKRGVYNKTAMAILGAVLISVITALSKGTSGSALLYIALQAATTAGAVWLVPNTDKEVKPDAEAKQQDS